MTRIIKVLPAIMALGVTACGDGSSSASSGAAPYLAPAAITVTSSLGLIQGGTVELLALDGSVLASSPTSTTGSVSLILPAGVDAPYILRVCGGSAAEYYDEGLDAQVPFLAENCLRSVVPDRTRQAVGVTPLTEITASYLEAGGGLAAVTPAAVIAATELVRTHLAPELTDILDVPFVVASATDLQALPATQSGRYALKIALLARAAVAQSVTRGGAPAAPVLDVMKALASDFSDGSLDGQSQGQFILSPVYDGVSFQDIYQAQQQAIADESEVLDALVAEVSSSPVLLFSGTPLPGDTLLSWRGSYRGVWSDNTTGSEYAAYLRTPFSTLLGSMVAGAPCSVAIGSQAVIVDAVDSLPLPFPYTMSVAENAAGMRSYSLSRSDDTTVSVASFQFPAVATGTAHLSTVDGVLSSFTFTVEGVVSSFGLSVQGQGTCLVSP